MTIEELKLANAIDTLIKEAESEREGYDNEEANYERCDKCYQSNYDERYNTGESIIDAKVKAYKEILKILHKKDGEICI